MPRRATTVAIGAMGPCGPLVRRQIPLSWRVRSVPPASFPTNNGHQCRTWNGALLIEGREDLAGPARSVVVDDRLPCPGKASCHACRVEATGRVAVRAVDRLIRLGMSGGIPRDVLMESAGVTADDLRVPDAYLPGAVGLALWRVMAQRIDDPGFGVRAGASVRVRQVGLLGYVACFSATLRDALRRIQRYGCVHTQAVEYALLEGHSEVPLVVSHPTLGPGEWLAQDYRIAAVLQVCREMTGVEIVPAGVSFAYPAPASLLAHRWHFRCPIAFGASAPSIVFHDSDLDLPLPNADEALAGYLSQAAGQALAQLAPGETMQHRVRAAIWSSLGNGAPSLRHVAAVLHLAPRTLQRRLAAEGTSLHAELDGVRKALALAVLRHRDIPIEEVATLVGYSEPSTFFRSFKRWTGTTPTRARRGAT